MDLKGILNDGPEESRKRESPDAQKQRQAQPPTPSGYGPQSYQQTPYSGPLSASPTRQSQPQGLAPLQTPSQVPGSGQYPFSQQPTQMSGVAPASSQQYRPYEGSSATTPFARPPSIGYQYPQPTASYNPPSGLPQSLPSHSTSSLSPTPPLSRHSPHSIRQSPSSARSNQVPTQHGLQHSQPTTPLGPPSHYPRPSNVPETQSPFHQRTFSSASNGIISGSPGQQQYAIGNSTDSPNALYRPPPHHRQMSEYSGRSERERSVSVSPKTKVPPRPPSLESRQSTQHELSRRESPFRANTGPLTGSPNHVMHPHPTHVAQPLGQPLNPASVVSQTTATSNQGLPSSQASNPISGASLSSTPRPLVHHSSSRMDMNQLLTPTTKTPSALNDTSPSTGHSEREMRPPLTQVNSAEPTKAYSASNSEQRMEGGQGSATAYSTFYPPQPPPPNHAAEYRVPSGGLKRPAEPDSLDVRPSKQRKTRKYASRPIWAKLSKHNPRYHQDGPNGTTGSHQPRHQANGQNGGEVQQTHGQPTVNAAALDGRLPWLNNPPLDHDLIHAQQILGTWEKTFRWNTPYPDMLSCVQEWLRFELNQLKDVGRDPLEGTIEIEAKFGTLKHEGEPFRLPTMSATIIHPQAKPIPAFESDMEVAEHKFMNDYLNESIQASMQPGRVHMSYKHLYETDSFYNLSQLGQQALPQSLQRRQRRAPRLRITRNSKAPGQPVKARIVKIPISNLHIFNPGPSYDCRISINLEVNLDRPELDLDALIAEDQQGTEVDRKKDRVSYKHLDVYSIDLTRVDRDGLAATFELELEVDSNVLREQMDLMQDGKPNAFGDVVSGFLDNATFLMRRRPPPQQP